MKQQLITQDPNILSGKPIIAGTRMSVESILELISSGMEIKDILKEYPFLTKKQIQAAVDFATKIVSKEEKSTPINSQKAPTAPPVTKTHSYRGIFWKLHTL